MSEATGRAEPGPGPAARIAHIGAEHASDAALLASLVTGLGGREAEKRAFAALVDAGGLARLLDEDLFGLRTRLGLDDDDAGRVLAAAELGRRAGTPIGTRGEPLDTVERLAGHLRPHLGSRRVERFVVLWLDSRLRPIGHDEIARGTVSGCPVPARAVLEAALRRNAAAGAFAHSHPSGDSTPSQLDRALTRTLVDTLALIEVRVVDHLVFGDDVASFVELGLL